MSNIKMDYVQNNIDNIFNKKIKFLKTGYERLDQILQGGFAENDFVILCADAKSGKTDMCFNLAHKMEQYKPLFFAIEDPIKDQIQRKIERFNLKKEDIIINFLTTDEHKSDEFTADFIISAIIKAKNEHGTKIVFIDNLDWIVGITDYKQSVSILNSLKEFCTKENICIVLIAHFINQRGTVFGTNRPDPQNLKGGSQVYQKATRVLTLWRQSEYDRKAETHKYAGYTRLILQADRWGYNGMETQFIFNKGDFEEITEEQYKIMHDNFKNNF